MKISVISKFRIDEGLRHALSPITGDNIIVRQFSPKRCMLEAVIPLDNGKKLHVVNVHLSAFAQGSNTMELQVSQVDELLSSFEEREIPGIAGGDFNLIPPGGTFSRLDEKGKKYFNPRGSEILPLVKKYRMIPTLEELNGPDYRKWLTNMAAYLDEKIPDKTIDYFFLTKSVHADSHYVRSKDTIPVSDHLPLITYITVE
jgi:endonuclease/exonuclease/phosphatase family metal-dependent hydrolase